MEITEEQRKRLLHAYATLMIRLHNIPEIKSDERATFNEAWIDITTILKNTDGNWHIGIDMYGGEWDTNIIEKSAKGIWEAMK